MFEQNEKKTGKLPGIAIRGLAPFPNTDVRTEVGRSMSKTALLEAERNHDSYVILLVQKNPTVEEPGKDDMLTYGIVAKIGIKIKLPNGNFKVKFDPIMRAEIESFEQNDPYFMVNFETRPASVEDPDEEVALVRMVVKQITENTVECAGLVRVHRQHTVGEVVVLDRDRRDRLEPTYERALAPVRFAEASRDVGDDVQ